MYSEIDSTEYQPYNSQCRQYWIRAIEAQCRWRSMGWVWLNLYMQLQYVRN